MQSLLKAITLVLIGTLGACAPVHVYVARDAEMVMRTETVWEVPAWTEGCRAGVLLVDSPPRTRLIADDLFMTRAVSPRTTRTRRLAAVGSILLTTAGTTAARFSRDPYGDYGMVFISAPIGVLGSALLVGALGVGVAARNELPEWHPTDSVTVQAPSHCAF